jgi:energy-coupling factor transport system permease protein
VRRPGPDQLNPFTKLAAALTGAALALAWGGWVAAAVLLLGVLAALRARRARRLAMAGLALVPVVLSSLLINSLLPAGGGVTVALAALLRLLAATIALTLLFATTPAAELLSDLEARGLGRRPAFVLGAALAAVPRAQRRALDVIEAQRARGLDTEGSWPRRLRGVVPLVAPLVIGSLADVEDRALALEARAFGAPGRRTVLTRLPDSRGQRVARWTLLGVLGLGLVLRALLR